jgi:FkbM family methyltransferase
MEILPNGVAVVGGNDCLSNEMKARGLTSDLMLRDILPLIKPGDWVVDAGAAMGDHTAAYLQAVGETGRVYAFEPQPEFFKCLTHNCPKAICINGPLFSMHKDFYLHSPQENIGAGYLDDESTSDNPDVIITGPFPTVILDEMELERLDYVKLDIEGSEYFAMLGMNDTVRRCKPKFVIEMNPGPTERMGLSSLNIYELLEQWGYDHKSIRNEMHRFCQSCDILAWPK